MVAMTNEKDATTLGVASERATLAALRKRPRIKETLIQAFLFVCGALSILITIGIVYELGKESALFFTRKQWEQTNKAIAWDMDAGGTTVDVTTSGAALRVDDLILLNQEMMRVVSIEGTRLTVERGIDGTVSMAHSKDTPIQVATEVTLREFFGTTEWNPQIGRFGIWALVNATMMTSLIALAVALPLGLSVAIYLKRVRIREGSSDAQADSGSSCRGAYGCLRILCSHVHDASAPIDHRSGHC